MTYRAAIAKHRDLRIAVLTFTVIAFVATGIAGAFGAFLNKFAPVRGGNEIHLIQGKGDLELGFKYRLVEQDKNGPRPAIGVFPLVEVPAGNQERGLGAGHPSVFLPVWIQKDFGEWTTYGGGGYWFNRNDNFGDKDYWFAGWLLQRKITEKLTLGGEIFYQTADTVDGVDQTGFNIGIIYDFNEHNHLLASAGSGLQNASTTNLYSWYLGWQITY